MSVTLYLLVGPILFIFAAWGSLSFIYPQLAFRIENIFQLRSVELSVFGVLVHKVGGLILIAAMLVIPIWQGTPELAVAAALGTMAPPLYFYHTRQTVIVQTFQDAVE